MRKKLFFIGLLSAVCLLGLGVYLQKVALPRKLSAVIIEALQSQTGTRVTLGEAQFSFLKGVVLKDVRFQDASGEVVSFKEGSFVFFIQPFFKKQVIIPVLHIKSARVLLKRKADNTFNLSSFLVPKTVSTKKHKFKMLVYRINVTDSLIDFQDFSLDPPLTRRLENVDLALALVLPAGVKFKIAAQLHGAPVAMLTGAGEYQVLSKEVVANFSLKDFAASQLAAYVSGKGFGPPEGILSVNANLGFKNNLWEIDLELTSKEFSCAKDKIKITMDAIVKAYLTYAMQDAQWNCSGTADVAAMDIAGLQYIDKAQGINGVVKFDNAGLYAENVKVTVFEQPVLVKIRLADFKNPALEVEAAASIPLKRLQALIAQKFGYVFPVALEGEGRILAWAHARPQSLEPPVIKGSLELKDGRVQYAKKGFAFEDIRGIIEFARDKARWQALAFKCAGVPYTTSGSAAVSGGAPDIQMQLASGQLQAKLDLSVKDDSLVVRKCSGKYLDSLFSVRGKVAYMDTKKFPAVITGAGELDLADLRKIFEKSRGQLDQIKPQGKVRAKFTLKGDLAELASSTIQAKCSAQKIWLWDREFSHVFMGYYQKDAQAEIPYLRASLYDGRLVADARLNLRDLPVSYEVHAAADRINIAKIARQAGSKDKDLSGLVQLGLHAAGKLNDAGTLSGSGKIRVRDGRFWELNLFKGLGSLLFPKGYFERIVFKEGGGDYQIKERMVWSDNLLLKSDIAELEGPVKIGFNGSLDGKLTVHILDETVPLVGNFKDVTTAMLGQSGSFGVIHLGGTLKDPKSKFKLATTSIINGIKNFLFSK